MIYTDIERAKKFFKEKFGSMEKVPPGTYAVLTATAIFEPFMKVIVKEDGSMSDFSLYMDKEFKEGYEETLKKYIPRKF